MGPAALAEPALRCLAVLAQTSMDNTTIARLSALPALLGLPCPEAKPISSCLGATLKTSATARKFAAKLLSKLVETTIAMDLLMTAGEGYVKELLKLALNVHQDGKGNLESLHDMLQVFYVITEVRPGPLAHYMTQELLHLFAELAQAPDDNDVTVRMKAIVAMLKKDPTCKKSLVPILQRLEEGQGPEPEDDLLLAKLMTPALAR